MTSKPLIVVVDDDADVRESIRALLETSGYRVRDYASAKSFLADHVSQGGCLIADIRMPEMDGLELQEEVSRRDFDLPVIFMTGHGEVPLAVRAMKAGAIDFIEKPFDDDAILDSIQRALETGQRARDWTAEVQAARQMIDMLTPRERTVLDQLVSGRSNKIAAHELGISPRTVEIHRAHIMSKMKARNLSDLVRVALAASPHPHAHA